MRYLLFALAVAVLCPLSGTAQRLEAVQKVEGSGLKTAQGPRAPIELQGADAPASSAPRLISYQGVLASPDGRPVPDGEYSVTVHLYSDSIGLRELWHDTYRVATRNGVFNIELGSGDVALPQSSDLDRDLWLSLQIGIEDEMKPLSHLTASPFALNVADRSISARKISADYVRSVSVNGQTLAGNGVNLDIQTGDGLTAAIDPGTGAIVLKGSGTTAGSTNGSGIQGNTTISGSLAVTGITQLYNSLTTGGNLAVNGNVSLGSDGTDSISFKGHAGSNLNMGGYNINNVGILDADSIVLGRALSAGNGGTGFSTYSAGDLLYGNSSGTLSRRSIGNAGQMLTISGGLPAWTSTAYPSTTSANQLLYSSAANTVSGLSTANNGVLVTNGSGTPSIGTTLPNAVQDNITRLGTVTSWGSTIVPIANGGTGATTRAAAFSALAPDTAGQTGKILTVQPGGGIGWASAGGSGTVTSIDVSGGSTGLSTSGGPITSNGTITLSGSVNSTHGGTGQTTYTAGDILYASAANTLSKLPKGATGDVLTVINGLPAWQGAGATTFGADGLTFEDIGGAAVVTQGGTGLTGYSLGDMLYKGALGNTLSRLAIGTAGKVLGVVSTNTPGYIDNGATITNNVSSPSALTGNTDNYSITSSQTFIRLTNSSGGIIDLTGISSSGVSSGRNITILNTSSDPIRLKHHGSSSSGNQFDFPGGEDIILGQRGSATFIYDSTAGYWDFITSN